MNTPHSILREEAGGGAGGGGGGTPPPAGTPPPGGGTPPPGGGTPPPPPPAAPYYKGLYGDDGKIDKAALDRLPDHLKPHKDVLGKYETIDALLTGFGNAHALASKKALTPLEANAPDHVKAERKAMLDGVNNVPKDPKGYGIARPETFPAEHWSEEGAGKMAAIAHKHSLSPDAVKELLGLQMELTNGELAKGQQFEADFYKAQDTKFAEAIRTQGVVADKALDLATRGAVTLGIDPKSPLFKNADVKLACLRMANLVGEDKLISGDLGGQGGGGGPDYLTQARDIMRNPQNPLHKAWSDPGDPRNEEVRAKVNELYRMDGEAKKKRGVPAP